MCQIAAPGSVTVGTPAAAARRPNSASSHLMNRGSDAPTRRTTERHEAHPPSVEVDAEHSAERRRGLDRATLARSTGDSDGSTEVHQNPRRVDPLAERVEHVCGRSRLSMCAPTIISPGARARERRACAGSTPARAGRRRRAAGAWRRAPRERLDHSAAEAAGPAEVGLLDHAAGDRRAARRRRSKPGCVAQRAIALIHDDDPHRAVPQQIRHPRPAARARGRSPRGGCGW